MNGSNVNKNTPFKIPSLSLNGTVALVPSQQPKFEFTNILSRQDYNALFAQPELNPKDQNHKAILDKVFTAPEAQKTQFYDSIEVVLTNSKESSITIKYKNASLP